MMIERLRELRSSLKDVSNQICELQSEIDEIERGVIEKPVPWWEAEWESRQPDSSVERVDILSRKQEGVVLIATAWEFPMTERIVGMQKLVKAVKRIDNSGDCIDTVLLYEEIRQALKEMGVDKE